MAAGKGVLIEHRQQWYKSGVTLKRSRPRYTALDDRVDAMQHHGVEHADSQERYGVHACHDDAGDSQQGIDPAIAEPTERYGGTAAEPRARGLGEPVYKI
jgi:hypothetical protein